MGKSTSTLREGHPRGQLQGRKSLHRALLACMCSAPNRAVNLRAKSHLRQQHERVLQPPALHDAPQMLQYPRVALQGSAPELGFKLESGFWNGFGMR